MQFKSLRRFIEEHSVSEAAARLGVTRATLMSVLAGYARPGSVILVQARARQYLGISPDPKEVPQ
jgi:predicted DNA-binding protein (UPF0251 family)